MSAGAAQRGHATPQALALCALVGGCRGVSRFQTAFLCALAIHTQANNQALASVPRFLRWR